MSPYTPNPLTQPIRTPFPKWIYYLAGVLVVLSMFVSAFAARQFLWVKWAIALTPLVLLVLREFYRVTRKYRINSARFSPLPPYAWKIETKQPEAMQSLFPVDMAIMGRPGISFLLLVEKQEEEDHQAHLYELFHQSLRHADIPVLRFYHKGDLQVFWNEEFKEGLPLEQVAQQFKNYQPILCGDGLRAVNHEKEELHSWAYHFYAWKRRILLTNRPASWWDYQETILKNCFTLIPFSREGIFSLVNFFSGSIRQIDFQHTTGPVQPELNADDPHLIEKLEAAFGPDLTRWIAATALSSKLDWDLTLKVGQQLSQESSQLLTFENISQLSRIPWFRTGEIPDAARQKLAAYLHPQNAAALRSLIVDTLEKSPPQPGSHAHNSYRMELAGLKALIPGFRQADLKNELYELKTMGYQEDVLVTDWIDTQKYWFDRLVPDSLERVAYNEGFFLLGRSFWFFLPLLLLFVGGVMLTPVPESPGSIPIDGNIQPLEDTIITPPLSRTFIGGQITGLEDEAVSGALLGLPDLGINESGNEMGQFRVDIPGNHANNRLQLHVEAAGYLPKNQGVQAGEGQIEIRLVPEQVTIHLEDGDKQRPIPDAVVHFENSDYRTDASGNAHIRLPGDYSDRRSVQFTVRKSGYDPPLLEKTEQIARRINVTLFPAGAETTRITGRVIDEKKRNPLMGVRVNTKFGQATTGDDGQFSLTVPRGEQVQADFVLQNYQPKSQNLHSGGGNEILLTPRINEQFYRFSGFVKDNCTGKTLAKVTFQVEDKIMSNSSSDGSFNFQLRGNPVEINQLEAVFSLDNYHPVRIPLSRLSSASSNTVNLSPKLIMGTVVDRNDNRVTDAAVNLQGAGNSRTDVRGTFRFENLPSDATCPMAISVEKAGYPPYQGRFMPGDKIQLGENLPQTSELNGRVIDRCTNAGVPKAAVKLNGTETVYTDGKGNFKATVGQQPYLRLEVSRGNDYYSFDRTYNSQELQGGISVQLTPGSLQGRVLNENKEPVSGASVTLSDDRIAITDNKGKFTFKHNENNECRPVISVNAEGYNGYRGQFTPGQDIWLSRSKVTPYVIIYVQRWTKGQYINAEGAEVMVDKVLKGKTDARGEIRVELDKRPKDIISITVRFKGYPGIGDSRHVYQEPGQRIALQLNPVD
jgi:hypothetical protein